MTEKKHIKSISNITAFLLLLLSFSFAEITISEGERFATLKIGASDSLQINELQNDYIQNSFRINILLYGALHPTITFNATAKLTTDNLNREIPPHYYEPFLGHTYDGLGEKGRTWDDFTARTEYKPFDFLNFAGGVDFISYGPARRNKLTLRGGDFVWRPFQDTSFFMKQPLPTPFFEFNVKIANITYSQTSMQIKYWKDREKYIHAHRLDFAFTDNFNLGLAETVVYGTTEIYWKPELEEFSVETVYLMPFVPYFFASHYLGDRDNAAISMDFFWKVLKGYELYGEFFIDDLNTITSFFDEKWWGNKWGTSLGIAIEPKKIGMFMWDYVFEFTRIEPWVYTHDRGHGIDYSHYGQSLGSDLGPNSREFYSKFGIDLQKKIRLDLAVSAVTKDTAFGSDIFDIHKEGDPTDKKYLNKATSINYREYSAALLWNPFSIWRIRAESGIIRGDYKGWRLVFSTGIEW